MLTSAGSLTIHGNQATAINGWAYDGATAHSASGVFLIADEKRSFPALYGDARPDVVRAKNVPLALGCGFVVIIPAGDLSVGTHHFDLDVLDSTRQFAYREANVLTLNVVR
jgi:hypothetical protein